MSKKTGTSLVAWDQQLLADAQLARASEESVMLGSFISLKGGQMSMNGNPFPNNKFNAIVLDSVLENVFYTGDYDPDSPQSPSCYAFARKDGDLKPHEKVEKPEHPTCKGCPNNEWGSAERGRGKACKNSRRLAVITADEALKSAEAMRDANIAYIRVPVTSVKAWAGYVTQLANVTKKPPYAVVTEIAEVPDAKSQFKLTFKLVRDVRETHVHAALLEKQRVAAAGIIFPYTAIEENSSDEPRGKKKASKFRR